MTLSTEIERQTEPAPRILMAPGPSNVPSRVTRAMAAPVLGHMDPQYFQVMDETMAGLRHVFQTENLLTFPLQATGGAAMEAAFANLVEPGDRVVVGIAGFFADRMAEIAGRFGAEVVRVEQEWGRALEPAAVRRALDQPTKLVALVHGETSTGVCQPLAEIVPLAHERGARVIVDTVASLGGVDLPVDTLGIDLCYSGSQKCLSAPPGLAPITLSPDTMAQVRSRPNKVTSWYWDFTLLEKYWLGEQRAYHHTSPASMVYALREACAIVQEEGLEARFARHNRCATALVAGLEAMGLKLFADPEVRLPTVISVLIPEGVDDLRVRRLLLDRFNLEITGGLGAYRGRMWRIGLMGASCTESNVLFLLTALEAALAEENWRARGTDAARAALGQA